jgi:hypothetical protein
VIDPEVKIIEVYATDVFAIEYTPENSLAVAMFCRGFS